MYVSVNKSGLKFLEKTIRTSGLQFLDKTNKDKLAISHNTLHS